MHSSSIMCPRRTLSNDLEHSRLCWAFPFWALYSNADSAQIYKILKTCKRASWCRGDSIEFVRILNNFWKFTYIRIPMQTFGIFSKRSPVDFRRMGQAPAPELLRRNPMLRYRVAHRVSVPRRSLCILITQHWTNSVLSVTRYQKSSQQKSIQEIYKSTEEMACRQNSFSCINFMLVLNLQYNQHTFWILHIFFLHKFM